MRTILLKFSGPLQSWGTSSHFETRHTDLYPSKSAVIGMIAAAFGYRREETEKIKAFDSLLFGVRTDQFGNIRADFQNAHKLKKPELTVETNYVTKRYYLDDSVFLVAIGHENSSFIDEIASALKHPYFGLYMGRRSCPVPEDFVLNIADKGIVELLESYPWQAAKWYQRKNKQATLPIHLDSCLLPNKESTFRQDKIVSLSFQGREYELRKETSENKDINDVGDSTEHDIFDALGD